MIWLLIPLGILLIWREWTCRKQMIQFGQPPGSWTRVAYDLCTLGALIFLLQPTTTKVSAQIKNEVSLAIAIDVSASMATQTSGISRLDLARQEILVLLDSLTGARVALIPFAGEPVVQVPLTTDHEALRFFLGALESGQVSASGSAPEEAAALAQQLLQGITGDKAVLLISDGERTFPLSPPELDEDIPVYTLSPGGVLPGKVPERNINGQPAMSQPDPARLKKISTTTGGVYLEATATDLAIDALLQHWQDEAGPTTSAGTWLLLALVLLLLRHGLTNRARSARLLASLCLMTLLACQPGTGEPDGEQLFTQAMPLPPSRRTTELFARAALMLEAEQRALALHNACSDALYAGEPDQAVNACEQALLIRPGQAETISNLSLALRQLRDMPPGSDPAERQSDPSIKDKDEGISATQARRMIKNIQVAPFTSTAPAEGRAIEIQVEKDW